jgi:hypothetical protein
MNTVNFQTDLECDTLPVNRERRMLSYESNNLTFRLPYGGRITITSQGKNIHLNIRFLGMDRQYVIII